MGLVPSTPDVTVGLLSVKDYKHMFYKVELNKEDKRLKTLFRNPLFGDVKKSPAPIVGEALHHADTQLMTVTLNHIPDSVYFFQHGYQPIQLSKKMIKNWAKALESIKE